MSGHSKWSQIKRQKGVADVKRGQVFTRMAKIIALAAKHGGSDPTMNATLRVAVEQARSENMPKDSIERAIKRGSGELGGNQIEELRFEAYGPGAVGILIDVATDNHNRSNSEIKAALNKYGGKLAASGAVAFQFAQRGVLTIPLSSSQSKEAIELAILESGATDYDDQDDALVVYTEPKHLSEVKASLEQNGIKVTNSVISWEPQQTVTIEDTKIAGQVIRLMEVLDDLDDVTAVTANCDFSPEVTATLGA